MEISWWMDEIPPCFYANLFTLFYPTRHGKHHLLLLSSCHHYLYWWFELKIKRQQFQRIKRFLTRKKYVQKYFTKYKTHACIILCQILFADRSSLVKHVRPSHIWALFARASHSIFYLRIPQHIIQAMLIENQYMVCEMFEKKFV